MVLRTGELIEAPLRVQIYNYLNKNHVFICFFSLFSSMFCNFVSQKLFCGHHRQFLIYSRTQIMLHHLFFTLLQVSIGKKEAFAEPPTAEQWTCLYRLAVEQSLVGVLYGALERLPEQQRPDKALTRKWFADTNAIERKYVQLENATVAVVRRFEADGYRVCLLKGIGNSIFYPQPRLRQCGDVDVWVDASPAEMIRYAHRYRPGTKALYHNVEMPVNSQLEVDIHYRPSHLYTPLGNYRLQRIFKEWKEEQFMHQVQLADGSSLAVPTVKFNLLYLLCHFNQHLFNEGIGFRQLMDYYYILLRTSDEERRAAMRAVKEVGLERITRALMYVLQVVFLLDPPYLLVEPDEQSGSFLLNEILATGNFGQFGEDAEKKRNKVERNWKRLAHNFHLMPVFTADALSEPLFRVYQWVWRQWMKRY